MAVVGRMKIKVDYGETHRSLFFMLLKDKDPVSWEENGLMKLS